MAEHTGGRIPRGAVLTGAILVAIAGDRLLYGSEGPGPNLFLLFVLLAMAVTVVSRRAGLRPSREAILCMGVGLLFASAILIRASPALQLLTFLAAAAAFALPALRAGGGWIRRSGVSDPLEAIAGAILHSVMGPLRLIVQGTRGGGVSEAESAGVGDRASTPPSAPSARGRAARRRVWAILRGALLAVPLLFVFGALFLSADPVFAAIVTNLIGAVELDELASHLLLIGALTWLTSGYLSGFVTGTRVRGWLAPPVTRPSLGILEAGTALLLVDLLFCAFVLVQLRYLFGGSTLVEITPGLTYAEYAREGFAQLVLATALVLPCLLASDWLLRRESPRDERWFRVLGAVQLLLLLVIVASAFQRLGMYQEAYGLTESRFYGAAFLAWLALVGGWFAATILRGRRDRFTPTALVSAFALVGGLLIVNPDARIASTNLARSGAPAPAGEPVERGIFDAGYLASLSADVVPTLLEALPALPSDARCTVARELQRRWGEEVAVDWRSWNGSEARARRGVLQAPASLLSTTGCPAASPASS